MDRVRLISPGWGLDRMNNLIIVDKRGGRVKKISLRGFLEDMKIL